MRKAFTRALGAAVGFGAAASLLVVFSGEYSRAAAAEYHVSVAGDDGARGTASEPFRTIGRAADLAQPGDMVTVHEGVYRERVNPPRGGESDAKRITYRAAPGEKVEIKGSEVVKNWVKVQDGVWKTTVSNEMFGDFNPYADKIHGDWFNPQGRNHHTGAVYINGRWLSEAKALDDVLKDRGKYPLWFGQVDDKNTALWAQFKGRDLNAQLVEINVRRTVFYPDKPGRNYITVRGFVMRHAATPWAPPTAEQIGLIGTHWSKGWIIENNVVSHSRCSGVTLGKYGDHWDNKSESAEGYTETVRRALKNGWNRETVGGHVVRGNVISDCEQTGICGSLGAVFSQIAGNHIHHIHVRRDFGGAEMAGIKIHAPIDVLIQNNRIHHCYRGAWFDWMAQGTRVSGNLCYHNVSDDLFFEVDHGPFVADNNLLLSGTSLRDWSEGGAYAHNLTTGMIKSHISQRLTPFHRAHSTALAGLADFKGGDNRFFNNIMVGDGTAPAAANPVAPQKPRLVKGFGLWVYDRSEPPFLTGGNVYFLGARPYAEEECPLAVKNFDPKIRLVDEGARVLLQLTFGGSWHGAKTSLVETSMLGRARVTGLPYENPDGSPLRIDRDYFGKPRNLERPAPGPFESPDDGPLTLTVWDSQQGRE
ncbi:MAG: right-handed parallel beta-helix repeat-containing protein [Pirellulales bacterium]|nr:right-handed parallel beta-helix repeat-containing protein [Pirellulales bacterium]